MSAADLVPPEMEHPPTNDSERESTQDASEIIRQRRALEEDVEEQPLIQGENSTAFNRKKNDQGVEGLQLDGYEKAKKKSAREIFWIKVKKETTILNLLAVLVAPVVAVAAGAYVNAMMPYLLQDKDYFGYSFDNVG